MSEFLQLALLIAIILLAAKAAGYLSVRLGQPSKRGEERSGRFDIVEMRGNGHESAQIDVRKSAHRFDEPRHLLGCAPGFLFFVTDVDLEQHLHVDRVGASSYPE